MQNRAVKNWRDKLGTARYGATRREAYLASVRPMGGLRPDLLAEMVQGVEARGGGVVLVRWTDYAKHLTNVFGERILAIADETAAKKGWRFRDVPATTLEESFSKGPAFFVLCDPEGRVEDMGEVTAQPSYKREEVLVFPSPHSNEGRFYDPWENSSFYRALSEAQGNELPSMLNRGRTHFLLECLRQAVDVPGDVLEVGAGQGGSGWAMARLLAEEGSDKRLVLLDFFEQLPRTSGEGIMHEGEIREVLSFYPGVELHAGNVDRNPAPILDGEWCFVHYDAGFRARRLAHSFSRLRPGGIIVLDNYGNVAANPRAFDRWFGTRGHRVSTVPHSGQGWVVKQGGRRGGDDPTEPSMDQSGT